MVARFALSFAVVTVLAGTAQAQTSHLIGQVSYPDRVQLGKTAVLELTLEDVSDATGAGVVIATMRMPKPGQTPVIFSLEYEAARVKPAGRYALRAHIVDAGARVLESAAPVRVLTQGAGAMASVTLVQVDPRPAAPSPLPEPKSAPAPKPLPAEASAKAGTPESKIAATPKPTPEPKTAAAPKPKAEPKPTSKPAPRPSPEAKVAAAPKPLPEPKTAAAPKPTPEPKSTPAPKPLPEPKSTPAPKPAAEPKPTPTPKATPAPKAAAQPTTKPAPVPKSTPTPPKPTPSINVASGAALWGTTWTIVEISGKPVGPEDRNHRKIVLAFDDNRQTYSGTSGCGDVAGRFARNGAPLTRTSDQPSEICHVDEQTERAMRSVIQAMRGYRVSGTTLELLDAKGACLAKLER